MVLVVEVPSTHPIESCGVGSPPKPKFTKLYRSARQRHLEKWVRHPSPLKLHLWRPRTKAACWWGVRQIWGESLREFHFLFLTRSFVSNSIILLKFIIKWVFTFFFFFPDKNSHYSLASISCAKYCPNRFFRLRRQWQRRLGSTTEWQSLLSTKRSFGWDSVFCIYDYLDSCFNESKIQYERLFSFICNVLIWHIIIGYGIYSHKRLNYFT